MMLTTPMTRETQPCAYWAMWMQVHGNESVPHPAVFLIDGRLLLLEIRQGDQHDLKRSVLLFAEVCFFVRAAAHVRACNT